MLPVLLAGGVAAGLTLNTAPAYRSSMLLFVTTGTGDPDARANRLNSYIALLTGPRVAQSVVTRLGGAPRADEVQRSLGARVQDGTDLLEVSATSASAGRSRAIVTTASSVLIGLARQLDPPPAVAGDGPPPKVSVAQDAVTVRERVPLVRNVGFAAVLGLLIGAAAVAVREATRRTAADEEDLRRLGIGAVGVISLGGGGAGRPGHPDEALAEAFRRLRSLLPDLAGHRGDESRGVSLMLTASNPKEGTTAVACGLAVALAETGARVALIDANLRSPGIGRYLALDTSPGLADVLTGRAGLAQALQDPLNGRLTVLPSGGHRPDPGEILASPALGRTVHELTDLFDVVLVDAPPLHGVADAAVLSKVTDGALLVVRANRTRTADVERSTDLLDRVGARLIGAVLNALPRRLPAGTGGRSGAGLPSRADHPGLVDKLVGGGMSYPGTVRGTARVVTDEQEWDGRVVRGQARVVGTEGKPGGE
jgi:capsular exopolysaccharide synthesis family protein